MPEQIYFPATPHGDLSRRALAKLDFELSQLELQFEARRNEFSERFASLVNENQQQEQQPEIQQGPIDERASSYFAHMLTRCHEIAQLIQGYSDSRCSPSLTNVQQHYSNNNSQQQAASAWASQQNRAINNGNNHDDHNNNNSGHWSQVSRGKGRKKNHHQYNNNNNGNQQHQPQQPIEDKNFSDATTATPSSCSNSTNSSFNSELNKEARIRATLDLIEDKAKRILTYSANLNFELDEQTSNLESVRADLKAFVDEYGRQRESLRRRRVLILNGDIEAALNELLGN